MRFELEPHHRDTPDDTLIADLRRVAAEAGSSSVTIDQYNERGQYHATTLTRRFGSWFKALELAWLPRTRNLNIPDEAFFENLVEVWTKLRRQPKYTSSRTFCEQAPASETHRGLLHRDELGCEPCREEIRWPDRQNLPHQWKPSTCGVTAAARSRCAWEAPAGATRCRREVCPEGRRPMSRRPRPVPRNRRLPAW